MADRRVSTRFRPVLGAVAWSLLLAACAPDAGPSPVGPSVSTPSPAVSSVPSSSGPFDAHFTEIGSANIVLSSCIGRFNGAESEWCPGTALADLVGDVTTTVRRDVAARPDPSRFADVSAAIAGLDESAAAVRQPCDDLPARKLQCLAAFNTMMDDWYAFTAATGYR
ncbi:MULTISPECIES: hypothetical protein [Catenuloplanes]|uniref:Uncharacterized protein n=1 Tax=Catenuloplanes niger TaxID=587534 RepID=A0AAE3ZVF3_9ACTN|nr:hypothetical protein [Catenuloplanes niger]MDR7326506.1 hypothetical protein [Catenuloplanes niger]